MAGAPTPHDPVGVMGLEFPNRLGLAAGYDKDARAMAGLACLGFGHLEVGTLTLRPQPGRLRPRLFRLPREQALINRMGFPSRGSADVRRELASHRRPAGIVIGVSLGLGATTPLEAAAEEYGALVEELGPLADYLALNVSSPNTEGLRGLQARRQLEQLLRHMVGVRDRLPAVRPPLVVKLSPDLDPLELEGALEAAVTGGAAGVVMGNTTTRRPGIASGLVSEPGGLSGRPLFPLALAQVRRVAALVGGSLVVIACGGVSTADDLKEMRDAGADLVQVFTALVFRGPRLVRRLLPTCA